MVLVVAGKIHQPNLTNNGTTAGIIHTVTPTANLTGTALQLMLLLIQIQPLFYHPFQVQTM
jgi:hypothetical protein